MSKGKMQLTHKIALSPTPEQLRADFMEVGDVR